MTLPKFESQDDTENLFENDDNGQGNYRKIQRRTGSIDRRSFYLGFRRRSRKRNDKNGQKRQRSEQNEHQSTILTIPPPLHTRKKQIS